jgi:probable DNA repair protein
MNWPGEDTLNSVDFQLVNRWRNLLNEFAQLEVVVPKMTAVKAVSRLTAMAGEALFQAELEGSVLSVLGPLEAAGMEFDRLWVAGLGADDWPPQGHPSPLLSRDLQSQHKMPDSSPQDTADYARRVLDRLRGSATTCHLSYASTVADREQLPTPLLADLPESAAPSDPGWHAGHLLNRVSLRELPDPAPPLRDDEKISGGAATINRQMSEPFAAFAFGRLGVRWLQAFTAGIAPNIRGSLVHDALFELYEHKPTQKDISAWGADELRERIAAAVEQAFERHERYADSVLRQLFRLERQRTMSLLEGVVAVDRERAPFSVATVERSIEGMLGPLRISLRGDRIDELENAEIVILDYKTGVARKFLTSGEPRDMQLVVYACITDRQVAGLGLFNVDSKLIGIDGAGPALADVENWQAALDRWKAQVHVAASDIAAGDVRLNLAQAGRDARPLNLLSRFPELKREL